jgi:hypothetical protein
MYVYGTLKLKSVEQCCGSGSEFGSVRIRNFLQDPDPALEVMDSDPKQEMHLNKNHLKIIKK